MPDKKQKVVKVDGIGTVSFPDDMEDHHIVSAIKKHKVTAQLALDPRLSAVEKSFPRLAPYLSNVQITQGTKSSPTDDRGLEFYPPWESENPNKGKITLQLFDKMQGPTLTKALGGDLLHYLGAVDPKTNKPVDPTYYAMKQSVLKARTPQQDAMDRREYANAVKNEGEKRPYDQWLQQSRIDAYIRGYVTPELGGKYPDEWRKQGQYKNPSMLKAVQDIQKYVTSAPAKQAAQQILPVAPDRLKKLLTPVPMGTGKPAELTTEQSEHIRQLKTAQPLSTAIPSLPDWVNKPLATTAQEFEEKHPDLYGFQLARDKANADLAAKFQAAHPTIGGIEQGVTGFAQGMTSPANLALMLGAPESKILSGIFATQAMRGSFRDAQSAKQAFNEGKNQEAMKYVTQALLGAGVGALAGTHAYSGLPEGLRTRLASEEGSVGPQEGGSERRANPELRKRIDEMTPEEMRKILKTSDVVDLPNKRSFLEDQHFTPMPFVARSDADGLKAFNDKFGYEKGDELLRAKADALKEAGLNAYHEKGDEFLYRGKSDKELAGRLEKAREILRNKVFDVTLDDGTHVQLKGVDFSYGTGKDLKEAEQRQHAHKAEREAAGKRKRGELVGLTQVGSEANREDSGTAQGGAAAPIAEIKKQAETLKPTTAYQAIDQSQPFYLKSENLINEKMKGPMAAEDVHKMLLSNGVKPEEMKWTGLDELLQGKGKQKVTPQEIQEHLAGNNLQVQEVTKGAALGAKNPNELSVEEYGKPYDQLDAYQQRYIDTITEAHDKASPHATKYGSYVLPGGEPGSYREIVLTLPENRGNAARDARIAELVTERRKGIDNLQRLKSQLEESGYGPGTDSIVNEIRAQSAQIAKAEKDAADLRRDNHDSSFRSNHWPDEPNPASHIRFDDRTGSNGERILFIEEAQDDWAQRGRKEGYTEPGKKEALQAEEKSLLERMKAPVTDEEIANYFKPGRIVKGYGGYDKVISFHPAEPGAEYPKNIWSVEVKEVDPHTGEPKPYERARWHTTRPEPAEVRPEIYARLGEIRKELFRGGVPDRPFKKTDEWTALVMKRMMRYAVDHGYDGVAWAPGQVHFDRWGSQRFDWKKVGDHWKVAGTEQHGGNAGGINLEEEAERQGYLQKDSSKVNTEDDLRKIVKKVMNRESNDAQIDTQTKKIWTRMQSEDSGTSMPRKEGFEAYYDQIVPQSANKLGKQWGAKVGKIDLNTGRPTSGPGWEQEPMWDTIARDGRLGKMPLYAIFDEGGNWMGTTGDPESGAVQPGEHVVQVADENGNLLKHVTLPSKSKTVPYLPLHPQAKAGIKSVPYSLFGAAGAALGLQSIKQKADDLQRQFRQAGLSR